jgi:hypothetical protein
MADCTKATYSTRHDACQALYAIRAKAKPVAGKLPVALYPCQHCHGWHLTSKKQSGKPRRWALRVSW